MNCLETQRFLHAYIDEEFDERERIEIEHHLSLCGDCRDEVEFYRALRRMMKQKLPQKLSPLHVEAKIGAALRNEKARPVLNGFSLSFAALMACVVVGGVSFWPSLTQVLSPRLSVQGAGLSPFGLRKSAPSNPTPLQVQPVLSIPMAGNNLRLQPLGARPLADVALQKERRQLWRRCLRFKRQKKWLRSASFPIQDNTAGLFDRKPMYKLLPVQRNTRCDQKDPFSPACFQSDNFPLRDYSTLCSDIR